MSVRSASTEDILDGRRQAFKRLASRVYIPQAAQQAWLANTHYPVASFLLYHGLAATVTIMAAVFCFVGPLDYPSKTVRSITFAVGAITLPGQLTTHVLCGLYGPDAVVRQPALTVASVFVGNFPALFLLAFNVCSREELVPFQSRFIFLVTTTVYAGLGSTANLFSITSAERGPPSTHPLKTMAMGALRAVRLGDGISDGMVVRLLWDRVRFHAPSVLPRAA